MKIKVIILAAASALAAACSNTAQPVSQNTNAVDAPLRADKARSTLDHTLENRPQQPSPAGAPGEGGRWAAGGNPIDTKEFDAAIASAEKDLKAKPADPAVKSAAAEAYFKRGFALTEARQYAAALGDLRKAQKLEPGHAEAVKWENTIIGIYEMMKKEFPKPGEEPTPLPFKG